MENLQFDHKQDSKSILSLNKEKQGEKEKYRTRGDCHRIEIEGQSGSGFVFQNRKRVACEL